MPVGRRSRAPGVRSRRSAGTRASAGIATEAGAGTGVERIRLNPTATTTAPTAIVAHIHELPSRRPAETGAEGFRRGLLILLPLSWTTRSLYVVSVVRSVRLQPDQAPKGGRCAR